MVKEIKLSRQEILDLLSEIKDPEIPVMSIHEMGMLRDVVLSEKGCEVFISPTYTACPAMGIIEHDIRELLISKGISEPKITMVYSPAWTTDWMTAQAREKLRAYGIAPPAHSSCSNWLAPELVDVECPRCRSKNTTLVSRFGSTACKALYTCKDCLEPFDYFKCH
jgi:ring-1,2-phenylacetyl-CoA epoxidase subunit PaaD